MCWLLLLLLMLMWLLVDEIRVTRLLLLQRQGWLVVLLLVLWVDRMRRSGGRQLIWIEGNLRWRVGTRVLRLLLRRRGVLRGKLRRLLRVPWLC